MAVLNFVTVLQLLFFLALSLQKCEDHNSLSIHFL